MQDEQGLEMEDLLVLKDEEGRDVCFEYLDMLEYEGEEYAVLLREGDASGELVILRLAEEGEEGESYVGVEDEEALNVVYELFREKHEEEFRFLDEE